MTCEQKFIVMKRMLETKSRGFASRGIIFQKLVLRVPYQRTEQTVVLS